MLDSKKILNEDNLTPAWNIICDTLGTVGKDFRTVSMRPRKGEERWFHASSYQGRDPTQKRLRIEKAFDPEKNSRLSNRYPIGQTEFGIVAKHYNDYVNEISSAVWQTDSHMASYIVTLIANLL